MISADKCDIRRRVHAERQRLTPEFLTAAGAAISRRLAALPVYQTARSVLVYLAVGNEVPTEPLIARAHGDGKQLYLPRQTPAAGFVPWSPRQPLHAGRGGVLEPAEGDVVVPQLPAIACIPLVAWSADGTRLGRGGGFYDRVLAQLPRALARIGLAFEFQHVSRLPRAAWDQPLDFVITEQRVVWCADSAPAARLQKGGVDVR